MRPTLTAKMYKVELRRNCAGSGMSRTQVRCHDRAALGRHRRLLQAGKRHPFDGLVSNLAAPISGQQPGKRSAQPRSHRGSPAAASREP